VKFNVTVQRTEYKEHTFQVEAPDKEGAMQVGLVMAGNHDFSFDRIVDIVNDVIEIVEVE
jgi:hypothetical protein